MPKEKSSAATSNTPTGTTEDDDQSRTVAANTMFLRRRRGRRIAREIAQRLGGVVEPAFATFGVFETARAMVRARPDGMDLRIYVCVPWIHVEDRSFTSHGAPGLALAVNAPLRGMMLTSLAADLSFGSCPVYVRSEADPEAARRFCRDPGNVTDVTALGLGSGEWLQVTEWQLWLRCRAREADGLMARLGPLARLHARARVAARTKGETTRK